jgi:hypothetical protein
MTTDWKEEKKADGTIERWRWKDHGDQEAVLAEDVKSVMDTVTDSAGRTHRVPVLVLTKRIALVPRP